MAGHHYRYANQRRPHSAFQDLKRETANRLTREGGQSEDAGDESSDGTAGVGAGQQASVEQQHTAMHYQQYSNRHYPREPPSMHYHGGGPLSPQNNPYPHRGGPRRDYGPPPYGYDVPNSYSHESRNYTDSQLGVAGGAGPGGGSMPPFGSPPPPHRPSASHQQLQQYSTPRMPRHATVLKDRGSAENSVGSDPSGGSENMGYGYGGRGNHARPSPSPALKGYHRLGSHGRNLNKVGETIGRSAHETIQTDFIQQRKHAKICMPQ